MCHDFPGYWARGSKDPDGGCGVEIVTSWDARLINDAIIEDLKDLNEKSRVRVVLHRSIRGPMAVC